MLLLPLPPPLVVVVVVDVVFLVDIEARVSSTRLLLPCANNGPDDNIIHSGGKYEKDCAAAFSAPLKNRSFRESNAFKRVVVVGVVVDDDLLLLLLVTEKEGIVADDDGNVNDFNDDENCRCCCGCCEDIKANCWIDNPLTVGIFSLATSSNCTVVRNNVRGITRMERGGGRRLRRR